MTKNECLSGYFTMMRQTIEHFGIPVSLYADRHTIFRSPNADKAEINSNLSANDTPVSYTHLDLDKIQIRYHPQTPR